MGASCSDIVAFISLHFPYFNNNYDECKVTEMLDYLIKSIYRTW